MVDVLPAHAILSVMRDLAEKGADVPLETICIAFANMLEDERLQSDDDLFGELVILGAGLWRHTAEFKAGGPQTVQ
ncbi:hypothetical protein HZY97_20115 [Sphingomonas sp. R-74633]|uniref:hypothetical protein n=1 Tax=Sphingomonas sp. R-74633 TaxID=2751188 RepID=UPI0015D2DCC5|nr:hypothetical protein [Sphingomonas sp. R-74633]NYT43091.1 hypothetical protein [Sphingomonas sp. R-74633]